jgi:RES domain-containing protein
VNLDDVYLALDQLGTARINGVYFRHTSPRRDPLSGAGSRIQGGRWNRRGSEALYLATPLDTCVAEFRRMADGQGKGTESFLPRMVHTIAVTNLEVVDLTRPGAVAAVGLEESDLSATDWSACHIVGDAVDTLGVGGLLAPSATGDGSVLTVYVRHAHHDQLTLIKSTLVEDFGDGAA